MINIKQIYKAVDDVISNTDLTGLSLIQRLFYLIYGLQIRYCKLITPSKIIDKWVPNFDINSDDDEIDDENSEETTRLDIQKLHNTLLENGYLYFQISYDFYYISQDEFNTSIIYLEDKGIEVYTYYEDSKLYDKLKNILTIKNIVDDKIDVGILVRTSMGYSISYLKFNKMNIDVDKTYNDDLPLDAIDNFVTKENTGLCMFYGEPGTGKSTFIKYLIQEYPKKNFIILNSEVLYDSTSNSLIQEFIENKNTIYIIEDCEKLLVSRNNEQNALISAFLNMTDGILAEVISCKFICTFNTELTNIDEALLRKGRLKLKYEFKKLSKDKVKNIIPECNEDMTVADIFNYKKENDFSKKLTRKIGFS